MGQIVPDLTVESKGKCPLQLFFLFKFPFQIFWKSSFDLLQCEMKRICQMWSLDTTYHKNK